MSLVKFSFKLHGKDLWIDWCDELKRRSDEVQATLSIEGVQIEACFLSEGENACYYLMQADDIEKALEVSRMSTDPIDVVHGKMLNDTLEYVEKLTPLFIFSRTIDIDK